MAADNAPLSYQVQRQPRGLDVRIATAAAKALGRELVVLPFETEFEKESSLTHEVNALLSSGVCDAVSGFPLLASDLGPATRPTSRTPDYPGAKRKRERPFLPLGTLVASRAYLAVSLGVVQRPGAPTLAQLGDLGDRRLGTVSGTLASAVAMAWHQGALRPKLVSLSQREDALTELAKPVGPAGPSSSRIDAAFVPLALFDGWQLAHPATPLVAAAYRRPIGINLGFVTLAPAADVRAALDRVITDALADGSLPRWAAEEGVSWAAPVAPEVSRGPSLAELTAD
jgi:ABC-type amino acid transport substrate-binding protein